MAEKHPYTSGGSGGLVQTINQLRSAFPPQVTSETLKKLGIAKNNETYIINILRFLDIIDGEGKKSSKAGSVFSKHEDAEFQAGLSELVQSAYSELFSLHGDKAWELPIDKLISFFRGHDETSAVVGQRQGQTFQTLAKLSGHGEPPTVKATNSTPKKVKAASKSKEIVSAKNKDESETKVTTSSSNQNGGVGLTVRIEINLPATGDQDTYDKIFKSIRENLLRGQS